MHVVGWCPLMPMPAASRMILVRACKHRIHPLVSKSKNDNPLLSDWRMALLPAPRMSKSPPSKNRKPLLSNENRNPLPSNKNWSPLLVPGTCLFQEPAGGRKSRLLSLREVCRKRVGGGKKEKRRCGLLWLGKEQGMVMVRLWVHSGS